MRDIANGRTVPASTCGIAEVKSANIIDTRPAMMSSSAGPVVFVRHVQHADFAPLRERVAANDTGSITAGERQLARMNLSVIDCITAPRRAAPAIIDNTTVYRVFMITLH